MQHLKKAMDEAEKAKKNYQLMEKEYKKAFAIMQRVNSELMEGNRSLMECRGGQLPQQHHDNILNPEIREAFGTGSVSEARMSIRESLRNYQKTGQQEPAQKSQKQSEKPQDFSNSQAEQSQPRQLDGGKTRNKISGKELHGKYEVEEVQHHVAERGQHEVEEAQHHVAKHGRRRVEVKKEIKKSRTMG